MELNRTLSPEYVSRLKGLALKARTIVKGSLTGRHLSPFHGFSSEFAQYKRYDAGDDLRRIDWRVFGKRDQLVIRQHRDETNASIYLVVDSSASMGYVDGAMSKLDYAAALTASVALLGFQQRDALSLLHGSGKAPDFLPPKTGAGHLRLVFESLEGMRAEGQTDLQSLLDRAALRMKSHSLTYLFTDLWQEPAGIIAGMKNVRAQRQEMTIVQILTPTEERFFDHANVELEDMETRDRLKVSARHMRHGYRELLEAHRNLLRRECFASGVRFASVSTDQPFYQALQTVLSATTPGVR